MKKTFLALLSAVLIMGSCTKKSGSDNPLLADWDTPYGTVPFDKIKTSDFEPAFHEAIKMHEEELKAIVENKEKPDFENTVAAFDMSGAKLVRVQSIYSNLLEANTNDTLQALQEKLTPLLSDHEADVLMNEQLFNRIKTVWDNRSKENLSEEQLHLLKKTYDRFIRNGALLDEAKKKELKNIKSQISALEDKYNANVLAETKNYKLIITDTNELKGLPQWLRDNAAATAKENKQKGWMFTLDNASVLPFLTYADSRKLRQQIFTARIQRCNAGNQYDNNKILSQILTLRAKMANVLGYKDYASWELEERMAKTPENAMNLMKDCLRYAVKTANSEAKEFQAMLSKDEKGAKLEGWDMYYYAEKVRKAKYDFDEEQTRPYFEIENVKQGCFNNITKLYGLTFTKIDNVSTWADDVDVYEVKNQKKEHVGILYFDPYTRNGKASGAWCTSLQAQYKRDGKRVEPQIIVCFNFAKQKQRTTLTADEAMTVFHEMGHATNEFLSDAEYPSTSGTQVPTDLVECPSQIAEHWAMEPEVLKTYAKNEKGEVIPQNILDKMKKASSFNQGFMFSELLAAAYLDMKMHLISADDNIDIQQFETSAMKEINMLTQIPPRYRSTYFTHIIGGGYAAGYYCYIWSEMLDADGYQAWKETGDIFNKEVSKKFADYILAHGGTNDADVQYRRFRGKEPDRKYMLINRGML